MLDFDALDEVARRVANTVSPPQRDDVYQSAWVYFLHYPPRKTGFAYTMARNARNNLWRRERSQEHLKEIDVKGYQDDEPGIEAHLELQRLEATQPRAFTRLRALVFSSDRPISGRMRRMTNYYRNQLKSYPD